MEFDKWMTGSFYDQRHGLEERGNPYHDAKGKFSSGGHGGKGVSGTVASEHSPVKGSDQTTWAEEVSRDMENSPLNYGSLDDPIARPLTAISHQQGFDGKPQHGSVDDAIAAGGLEIHRGIIPHEKSGTSAEQIRDKMIDGPYEPGRGNYGNGYYFSTSPGIAKMYSNAPIMVQGYNAKAVKGGVTVRAALHKDAKIVDYQDIKEQHLAWAKSERERVHWNTYETNFQIPEGKVSPELLSQINDPGHFAALMGYDAIRVPLKDRSTDRRNKARIKKKIGSDDLGDEIVVLNRTALVVE
jgi:hypothetical protein